MTIALQDIIPLQLKIVRCGHVELNPKWNKEDGFIKFSRLYLVEEGSGYLKTEKETIALEPGYAYLIPACFHHAYGCTRLKKIYFMFSLSVRENIDLLSGIHQVCRIPYDPQTFSLILGNMEKTDCLSVLTLRQTLMALICSLLQENRIPVISTSRYSPLVENTIAYIHAHARIDLTIRQISSHLFVSESKLRSTFLAETSTTVGKYIDKQVMQRAKLLLGEKTRSIGEISTLLGFCDQFYFSRRFKEQSGMTPSAYRKSLLN